MIITQERVLRNAFHSARMEGFEITAEIETDVERLLSGEITIEQYFEESLI